MNGPPMPALGVVINGPHHGGGGPPPNMISPAGGVIDLAAEDFEPQLRDRCNTWPLQKPAGDLSHHTSPLIHEEIPEECDDVDGIAADDDGSVDNLSDSVPFGGTNMLNGNYNASDVLLLDDLNSVGTNYDPMSGFSAESMLNSNSAANSNSKKNSARRNAWGNLSYADLITQAILSSNEKRLTLSQIYDWMVHNVPYFRDKGDSNSSAGWKNSIRHNLSLHSRFMRIQNEGAGKSSWWIINPEAKPGKSSRRRTGSMEQSKNLDKKRGRVKKKLDQLRASTGHLLDGSGRDLLNPEEPSTDIVYDVTTTSTTATTTGFPSSVFGLSPGEFRQRSDSNLSNYSVSSQRAKLASPLLDNDYDDWGAPAPPGVVGDNVLTDYPEELLDTLNQSMTLEDQQQYQQIVRDNNSIVCQPPPYSTFLAENSNQQFCNNVLNSQQQHIGRQTSPVDASPRRQLMTAPGGGGGGGGGGGSTATTPNKSPQRFNVKTEPSPLSFALRNNNEQQQLAGGGGFAAVKTEPPAYQELYPQGGRLAVSNPMLLDVLQKSTAAAPAAASSSHGGHNFNTNHQQMFHHSASDSNFQQQQHQQQSYYYFHGGGGGGGGSSGNVPQQTAATNRAGAGLHPHHHHHPPLHHNNHHHHHNGQLPSELSEIRYDNHFTSDIQCDIDQVIRHELNVAGKIDFGDFGNIQ